MFETVEEILERIKDLFDKEIRHRTMVTSLQLLWDISDIAAERRMIRIYSVPMRGTMDKPLFIKPDFEDGSKYSLWELYQAFIFREVRLSDCKYQIKDNYLDAEITRIPWVPLRDEKGGFIF